MIIDRIQGVLLILMLALIAIACIVFGVVTFVRSQREQSERLREFEAVLQEHDQTVQALTAEGFERHRRTCPRCRGDVLGRRSITTDALTDFRS